MRGTISLITIAFFFSIFAFIGRSNQEVNAGNVFNDSIEFVPWYTKVLKEEGISPSALNCAYEGFLRLKETNKLSNDTLITLIDFSKPSNNERLYIIDIKNGSLVWKSLVAHGKNSGVVYAESFSNLRYSNKSSLGLFITSNTYKGKHGYSLRIDGVDEKLNSNARERAVVVHGANYVSKEYISNNGRLGRSFGCPAIPYNSSNEIINLIKHGSCLFIYHPSLKQKT